MGEISAEEAREKFDERQNLMGRLHTNTPSTPEPQPIDVTNLKQNPVIPDNIPQQNPIPSTLEGLSPISNQSPNPTSELSPVEKSAA